MICWFHVAEVRRRKFFQRDRVLSFTSLQCHRAPVFADEKMLQRRQQVRTQASLLSSNIIKIPALQQQGKKTLGKIFRFLWPRAFSPDEGVNGSPVGTAKPFERLLGRWRSTLR